MFVMLRPVVRADTAVQPVASWRRKGSLFATRPTLFVYIAKRAGSGGVGRGAVRRGLDGKVKIRINQRYALKDAARRMPISKPQDHRHDHTDSVSNPAGIC